MSEMSGRTGADARHETRQRREERTDAVVELPFNERVEVDCPVCGETFETTIATGNPSIHSPTFGRCTNWKCNAFLKFRSDGSEGSTTEDSEPTQMGLTQFAEGEMA